MTQGQRVKVIEALLLPASPEACFDQSCYGVDIFSGY
jgi:hypothetical protein